MKPGGYSDSGADIGYTLFSNQFPLITPRSNPTINRDLDWVFPDTHGGIQSALNLGARTFWLNTVLYQGHPIEQFQDLGLEIVGQTTVDADQYDDKWFTNNLLKKNGLPIPDSKLVSLDDFSASKQQLIFPIVIKPIRGRGSQGVVRVNDKNSLIEQLIKYSQEKTYGQAVYIEKFLSGRETTFTVMPPGKYLIHGRKERRDQYWCLPAVVRFNHQDGVAPYNGVVAVVENSKVLADEQLNAASMIKLKLQCEKAATLVQARAPIRIDCRADEKGHDYLFDLNMKPNMTGPSRPHRLNQDSLTMIAARKIGWGYQDLIANILAQRWKFNALN